MNTKKWLWLAAFAVSWFTSGALAGGVESLQIVGTISSPAQSLVLLFNPETKHTTAVSLGDRISGFPGYELTQVRHKSVLVKGPQGTVISLSTWISQDSGLPEDVATTIPPAPVTISDKPIVIVDTYKWIRDVGLLKDEQNSEMIKDGNPNEIPNTDDDYGSN